MSHKECSIASHRHGVRTRDGQIECSGRKGGIHTFNGREIRLVGNPIPLVYCSKCNLVAAYYRCDNK